MTSNPEETKGGKRPYVKPQITEMELRPEEAVLGFCKKAFVAGPLQWGCNVPANCFNQGS